jgi:hypothetical protein
MTATIEREQTTMGVPWERRGAGSYQTWDRRWRAYGSQVTGDDGWWLAERQEDGSEAFIEPFGHLRDVKAWVSRQYATEHQAREFEKSIGFRVEPQKIESGNGTIYRLLLVDSHGTVRAEVFVRHGQIAIETDGLDADAAAALAGVLVQAAQLAEEE